MSAGLERLKDEVSLGQSSQVTANLTARQGSRKQVIVAGGFAGLVSRFCIAPLDVVKIRLQLQPHSLSDPVSYYAVTGPTYKGWYSALKDIAKQEGITALWKGNIPAELLYLCYGG